MKLVRPAAATLLLALCAYTAAQILKRVATKSRYNRELDRDADLYGEVYP